jgi:outer membrane protein insertion porin family
MTTFSMPTSHGLHHFSHDLAWRSISSIAEQAAPSVRLQAGHTIKSSLAYAFARGTRDDPFLPTRGYHVKLSQELAGLGGTVRFSKTEASAQIHATSPMLPLTLSLAARSGLLVPLDGRPSSLIDRFFVGGPLSVRGFNVRGVGPHEKSDALGGDLYLEAKAGLSTLLLSSWPGLRAHVFANAGQLCALPDAPTSLAALAACMGRSSLVIGCGVAFKVMHAARLEINFVHPIRWLPGHRPHPGLQFGLGVEFL